MLRSTQLEWQTKTFDRGVKIPADADTLWSIEQGAIKITTRDLSGTTIVLGYWGKGDVVGQSLTPRNIYEIECLTPVKVKRVPDRDWHYLAKEIRSCHQDMERIVYILRQKTIEEKLTELLVYLSGKFNSIQEDGKAISLPLTHRELAEFFGVTRANIAMAINRLQRENILDNPMQGSIVLHISKMTTLEYKI